MKKTLVIVVTLLISIVFVSGGFAQEKALLSPAADEKTAIEKKAPVEKKAKKTKKKAKKQKKKVKKTKKPMKGKAREAKPEAPAK